MSKKKSNVNKLPGNKLKLSKKDNDMIKSCCKYGSVILLTSDIKDKKAKQFHTRVHESLGGWISTVDVNIHKLTKNDKNIDDILEYVKVEINKIPERIKLRVIKINGISTIKNSEDLMKLLDGVVEIQKTNNHVTNIMITSVTDGDRVVMRYSKSIIFKSDYWLHCYSEPATESTKYSHYTKSIHMKNLDY